MQQFELSDRFVDKVSIGTRCTLISGNREISFDEQTCECSFFNVMRLPCRHLFALFKKKNMDLYVPELCDRRWFMNKFENFKKSEGNSNSTPKQIPHKSVNREDCQNIVSSRREELNELQKFREIREMAVNLADLSSKQPGSVYETIRSKLEKFIDDTVCLINSSDTLQHESPPREI